MSQRLLTSAACAAIAVLTAATSAHAQLAVSANDGKVRLVDGVVQTVKDGKDTVSIIDLAASPPKLIAEIEVPASVVGPPMSVAIGPKEDIALVTSATKFDPADPTKTVPDTKLTVIDLANDAPTIVGRVKAATGLGKSEPRKPPIVIATLEAGRGAAGVSINPAGTLALVANRSEGTISIFTIEGKSVKAAGKIDLGNDKSGPSHVVFTPDGKTAYVSRDTDHKISVLSVDGTKVEYTKRDLSAGLRPYGIDMARNGTFAAVANIGVGAGDSDTISIIDLKATPSRVVSTVTVGQTPEGLKIAPDNRLIAVTVMNGSNKPANSPFYKANGLLQIWSLNGADLKKVAEAPVGKWCQGAAWNRRSNVVLVQCMVEEEIQVFRYNSGALTKSGVIKTKGGPAGIRTVEK